MVKSVFFITEHTTYQIAQILEVLVYGANFSECSINEY